MNKKNAQKVKLSLPPVFASIIGDRPLIRRLLGRNSQYVFAAGKDLYLKISSDLESLRRERDTCIWLEDKLPGFTSVPRVGAYNEAFSAEEGCVCGYLLSTAIQGTPASSPAYTKDPPRLISLLAEAMEIFHALSPVGCPSAATAKEGDVLIHGDFCLPNIILHRNRVSGFVDLGQVTVGDPWEDYAWCLWSLRYNLKTDQYDQQLLDALGITLDPQSYRKYVPYEN